jgi:hypothetical protein
MSLTSRTFHIVDGCVLHKKKCKAARSSGLTFGSIFGIFSKKSIEVIEKVWQIHHSA